MHEIAVKYSLHFQSSSASTIGHQSYALPLSYRVLLKGMGQTKMKIANMLGVTVFGRIIAGNLQINIQLLKCQFSFSVVHSSGTETQSELLRVYSIKN